MSTNGHQSVASGDGTDVRFNKLYQTYVAAFVEQFETALGRYYRESRGRAEKQSKRFYVLEAVVAAVMTGLGVGGAGRAGGSLLTRYLGTKHHAERANAIYANLGRAARETVTLRATLVEAATDIFRAFESQFTTLESAEGLNFWDKALEELATEAIVRILDHGYHNTSPEVTANTLTRAFVHGRSKPRMPLISSPPKVTLPNGTTCSVSELYDGVHLVKLGHPDVYYRKRKTAILPACKTGYRLLFAWEDAAQLSDYEEFQPKIPPASNRSYVLVDEELAGQKMVDALTAINEQDPNFKLNAVHAGVNEIRSCLNNGWMEKLVEKLNEIQLDVKKQTELPSPVGSGPKRGGITFELGQAVDPFFGRQGSLRTNGIYQTLESMGSVALVGPGGIGKSELARAFASRYKAFYRGNVAWIDCTNRSNATTSFVRLAKRITYADTYCDHADTPSPFPVGRVHAHFRDLRCLFVLDNVGRFQDIENLLPCGTGPRVLITSRDPFLGLTVSTLSLNALTEEEALNLVRARLNEPEKELGRLVGMLHRLPLALQLAVAYIVAQRPHPEIPKSEMEIANYLAEISREFQGTEDDDEVLSAVISLSWISMRNEDLGEKATQIMEVVAFLSSDHLSRKIFSKLMMDENKDRICKEDRELMIRLIARYSLISQNDLNVISTRSLIQETLRQGLSDDRRIQVLRSALVLMRSEANERHIVSVWHHAIQHRNLVSEFCGSVYGGERDTILHLLAREGHHDMTCRLLDCLGEGKEECLNARNKSGNNALHLAARHGHLDVLRYLEDQGTSADARNDLERTPFQEGAFKGQLHIVQHFAQTRDCAKRSVDNVRLVGCAATSGNVRLLQYLVEERGAECWARHGAHSLPIHAACRANMRRAVDYLLGVAGANADARDGDGNTPLHIAARYGHVEMARALVEVWGADVIARNSRGKSAAHAAAGAGHLEAVQYLVGCEGWQESNKYSLLHEAAYNRQPKMLEYLVRVGGAVEKRDSFGNTPLHEAAAGGDVNCVRLLVDSFKVNVDALNTHGKTPLHKAAGGGRLEVVCYLVEDCARKVDVLDHAGGTPLHEATYGGSEDVVRYLVGVAGANVHALNKYGRTPLYGAVKNPHYDVMRYLVEEKRCLVDIADKAGKTPLKVAVINGNQPAIDYLEAAMKVLEVAVTASN